MALTNPAITRDAVKAKLEGQKTDISGAIFKYSLIACLLVVLISLMESTSRRRSWGRWRRIRRHLQRVGQPRALTASGIDVAPEMTSKVEPLP